ncbi:MULTISPECIES: DUF2268 domain-containing putative Zn-dependent protease [Citrobacter freundii complex]|uniref:DUF2268 domain-containing putative Zn-dependent protease n=1 Tax=Citrobacter sp. RTP31023st1_F3_RTP31023_210422 TaxID=3143212 RepID=UPI001F46705E|nr:DUF2268 domain-containing putative Zn-dependent protease [Citrobacter youngae]
MLHHAARWQGPGYGSTLGEALVSKGLADHFSLELFGGEPELWERLSLDLVQPYIKTVVGGMVSPTSFAAFAWSNLPNKTSPLSEIALIRCSLVC